MLSAGSTRWGRTGLRTVENLPRAVLTQRRHASYSKVTSDLITVLHTVYTHTGSIIDNSPGFRVYSESWYRFLKRFFSDMNKTCDNNIKHNLFTWLNIFLSWLVFSRRQDASWDRVAIGRGDHEFGASCLSPFPYPAASSYPLTWLSLNRYSNICYL